MATVSPSRGNTIASYIARFREQPPTSPDERWRLRAPGSEADGAAFWWQRSTPASSSRAGEPSPGESARGRRGDTSSMIRGSLMQVSRIPRLRSRSRISLQGSTGAPQRRPEAAASRAQRSSKSAIPIGLTSPERLKLQARAIVRLAHRRNGRRKTNIERKRTDSAQLSSVVSARPPLHAWPPSVCIQPSNLIGMCAQSSRDPWWQQHAFQAAPEPRRPGAASAASATQERAALRVEASRIEPTARPRRLPLDFEDGDGVDDRTSVDAAAADAVSPSMAASPESDPPTGSADQSNGPCKAALSPPPSPPLDHVDRHGGEHAVSPSLRVVVAVRENVGSTAGDPACDAEGGSGGGRDTHCAAVPSGGISRETLGAVARAPGWTAAQMQNSVTETPSRAVDGHTTRESTTDGSAEAKVSSDECRTKCGTSCSTNAPTTATPPGITVMEPRDTAAGPTSWGRVRVAADAGLDNPTSSKDVALQLSPDPGSAVGRFTLDRLDSDRTLNAGAIALGSPNTSPRTPLYVDAHAVMLEDPEETVRRLRARLGEVDRALGYETMPAETYIHDAISGVEQLPRTASEDWSAGLVESSGSPADTPTKQRRSVAVFGSPFVEPRAANELRGGERELPSDARALPSDARELRRDAREERGDAPSTTEAARLDDEIGCVRMSPPGSPAESSVMVSPVAAECAVRTDFASPTAPNSAKSVEGAAEPPLESPARRPFTRDWVSSGIGIAMRPRVKHPSVPDGTVSYDSVRPRQSLLAKGPRGASPTEVRVDASCDTVQLLVNETVERLTTVFDGHSPLPYGATTPGGSTALHADDPERRRTASSPRAGDDAWDPTTRALAWRIRCYAAAICKPPST